MVLFSALWTKIANRKTVSKRSLIVINSPLLVPKVVSLVDWSGCIWYWFRGVTDTMIALEMC